MKKSTLAIGSVLIVALVVFAVIVIYPQEMRDFIQSFVVWFRSIFHRGEDGGVPQPTYGEPPNVSVSLSVTNAYLGDYPEATFTVTNTGGSCTVSYTIFETAPQTGSLSLDKGESKTVNVTAPQARDIGTYSASVQVSASNSYGSDSAQTNKSFNVNVEPFDATPHLNLNELEKGLIDISELLKSPAWFFYMVIGDEAAAIKLFVTPDSKTIKTIMNELTARHSGDRELQAKEIYYWVRNWISYRSEVKHVTISGTNYKIPLTSLEDQIEYPVETLYEREGICVNYSLVLASLYKAAGFNVRIIYLKKEDLGAHAANLLYLPAADVRHSSSFPEWVDLDATNCPKFGEAMDIEWDYWDWADV